MRSEWVTLVKLMASDETFQQETPVSSTSCWAEKKSVVRSEFYKADANGRAVNAAFELSPIDYSDQQKLVHHAPEGDVEYRIVRDFKRPDKPDAVELTCSRITE